MFVTAETAAGPIVGLQAGPIAVFRGVPYAEPASGRNRFRAPQRLREWQTPRNCFNHGPGCPQAAVDGRIAFGRLLQFDQVIANGGIGEDCLRLSLWTPGLGLEAKRPVIISFHGGGFGAGSGNIAFYDGAELAFRGDVVVVNVAHRLHAFGFVDLTAAGVRGDVEDAGVAGLLDLVEALRWVRENITNFGGDPDRVTLMGQSGGGWKVSALLAMPSAQGLFHRAIIQSGSRLYLPSRETGATAAAKFVAELGVPPEVDALCELPFEKVLEAAIKVGLPSFEPVVGGSHLPSQPVEALDVSAEVPLIISSTLDDSSFLSQELDLTQDRLAAILQERYGDHADDLLRLYQSYRPGKSPFLLLGEIVTDAGFRRFAHIQAEQKATLGRAPVFTYQWRWPSPAFGGCFGAAHGIDVAASFHNLHDPTLIGATAEARPLADALSSAVVAFAREGVPTIDGSVDWPAFSLPKRATVILNDSVEIVEDPDRELREFWERMPLAETVFG